MPSPIALRSFHITNWSKENIPRHAESTTSHPGIPLTDSLTERMMRFISGTSSETMP